MKMRPKLVLVFLLALLAGCDTLNDSARQSPAAQTPSGLDVRAVLQRGGGFVNVGPTRGIYEILPGALPSQGFQLSFSAPYPTSLRILLDAQELPRLEAIPSGADPAVSGYYRIDNVNPSQAQARWRVSVRPPASKLSLRAYAVRVATISINPNFAVNTPEHESAPLIVQLGAQRIYSLTVASAGAGSGRIGSTPAGINCGTDCTVSLGQSQTLSLTAQPASGSRFIGWSSICTAPSVCNCFGRAGGCSVTLNGSPVQVTAQFEPDASGMQASACPAPRVFPDMTLAGQPACASRTLDQHPSAVLACDSGGYFCCESVIGSNSARCGGGDRRDFPADCLNHVTSNVGPPPNGILDGCYRRNGP